MYLVDICFYYSTKTFMKQMVGIVESLRSDPSSCSTCGRRIKYSRGYAEECQNVEDSNGG